MKLKIKSNINDRLLHDVYSYIVRKFKKHKFKDLEKVDEFIDDLLLTFLLNSARNIRSDGLRLYFETRSEILGKRFSNLATDILRENKLLEECKCDNCKKNQTFASATIH